jgi:hypothetical protein
MEYKFYEGEYNITKGSIPIMLKAFSCGTRFVITSEEWHENIIEEETFWGKRLDKTSDLNYNYIMVSNDERRRLIPILEKLQAEKFGS